MQTYNIKSRRRQWTAYDSTIKSIRVFSDPALRDKGAMWEIDNYYEFSIDVTGHNTVLSLDYFPLYHAPMHKVNEEGYTNPNSDLPVMQERYILKPKYYDYDIIIEFFGDYDSVVIYGLPDEAYVIVEWTGGAE